MSSCCSFVRFSVVANAFCTTSSSYCLSRSSFANLAISLSRIPNSSSAYTPLMSSCSDFSWMLPKEPTHLCLLSGDKIDYSRRFVALVVLVGLLIMNPLRETFFESLQSSPLSLFLNKVLPIRLLNPAMAGVVASSVMGSPYSGSEESIFESLEDLSLLLADPEGLASNLNGWLASVS